mgnify:FL=1
MWEELRNRFNQAVQEISQLDDRIFGSLGNILQGAATFIVNGLLSVFLWFVTLGVLLYANLAIMRAIGSAMRL